MRDERAFDRMPPPGDMPDPNEGLSTPDDIERFDDLAYGPDPVWQILDVYRPKEAAGEVLPVIINIHGGGWTSGDKEMCQFYCMSLAQRGFAVVNFTYRLAPAYKFPAGIEDTNLVAAWVLAHADAYGFDTDHIFAVGDSAGGQMLGVYAAICTNPSYAASFDFTVPDGFRLTAIALNCSIYSWPPLAELDPRTAQTMQALLPAPVTDDSLARISVVNHITEDFPPTLYMTCTRDFEKEQAPLLGAKLLEKDVPHTFLYYGDSRTDLGHVFHLNIKSDIANRCNEAECSYFKEFL